MTWRQHGLGFLRGNQNITVTIGGAAPCSQGSSEASSFDSCFLDNKPLKPREEAT